MTELDPAMIERAAEALWDEMYVTAWSEATADEKREFGAFARAAAAVIVPATVEAIAAEIRHAKPPEDAWALGHWYLGRDRAAEIARAFAADLSAGATAGDDADRGYSAALDAGLLTAEETAKARKAVTRDD